MITHEQGLGKLKRITEWVRSQLSSLGLFVQLDHSAVVVVVVVLQAVVVMTVLLLLVMSMLLFVLLALLLLLGQIRLWHRAKLERDTALGHLEKDCARHDGHKLQHGDGDAPSRDLVQQRIQIVVNGRGTGLGVVLGDGARRVVVRGPLPVRRRVEPAAVVLVLQAEDERVPAGDVPVGPQRIQLLHARGHPCAQVLDARGVVLGVEGQEHGIVRGVPAAALVRALERAQDLAPVLARARCAARQQQVAVNGVVASAIAGVVCVAGGVGGEGRRGAVGHVVPAAALERVLDGAERGQVVLVQLCPRAVGGHVDVVAAHLGADADAKEDDADDRLQGDEPQQQRRVGPQRAQQAQGEHEQHDDADRHDAVRNRRHGEPDDLRGRHDGARDNERKGKDLCALLSCLRGH